MILAIVRGCNSRIVSLPLLNSPYRPRMKAIDTLVLNREVFSVAVG